MVEEIPKGMESLGFSPKTVVTVLIFAFGIVLFLGGVELGKYVQYQQMGVDLKWYGENCECKTREWQVLPSETLSHNTYYATNFSNSMNET